MTARRDESLDLDLARERFEESVDFTMAVEEEFAILDPETLELAHGFGELLTASQDDPLLADSVRGELIDTEIEIRSGRSESFAEMLERQAEHRRLLFALAEAHGFRLASSGTHPWASYLDQAIIETPHYQRLRAELGWVAQRNNTWSLHAHVGVRGADRAIAVCDQLRNVLPTLLALSSNSPFLDGQDSGLHSVRTQIFTRTFPRCGVHDPFGDWSTYADFVDLLERTGSIVESTQLWWSVRPHHAFGTVEVRICDAQTRGEESLRPRRGARRLCRSGRARLRRGRARRAAAGPRDRGEPLAGDPLRARRQDDRLRSWGGDPHGSGDRAADRLDRAGARASRDRRPEPVRRPERRAASARGGAGGGVDRGDLLATRSRRRGRASRARLRGR